MMQKLLLASLSLLGIALISSTHAATPIDAITNCNGTQIVRTAVAKFEVRTVEKNMPGCINVQQTVLMNTGSIVNSTSRTNSVMS